jgi:hypothetical protein
MLSRCLIFRVVTPLYFAHLDDLIASHSFGVVQDLDWPFAIGQTSSKVKIFYG